MSKEPDYMRINRRYAVAWQNKDELRFGFTRPVLVLSKLSPAANKISGMLTRGVAAATLDSAARHLNIYGSEFDELMRALTPVLEYLPYKPEQQPRSVLCNAARFAVDPPLLNDDFAKQSASQIAAELTGLGAVYAPDSHDILITLHRFMISQRRSTYLSRENIAQLPIVFTDSEIRVGPLITEDGYPCAMCIEKPRLDSDEHIPALTVQLMTQPAPTETSSVFKVVAPLVAQLLNEFTSAPAHIHSLKGYIFDAQEPVMVPRDFKTELDSECLCGQTVSAQSNLPR